jgi:2-polyprenyl-3-methyl-5-hydroxy-6-metoxy-1,4-benzoquinol methylase
MTQEQWEELTKYGRHLDFNVKRLNETKDEIVKIQSMLQYLIMSQSDDLKSTVNRLADRFGLLEQQLVTHGLPKIDYYDHEFSTIRKMAEGDQWPQAVENIVRDENYQRAKAAAIIDMVVIEPITGKRVLDYGCGSGYLTNAIKERGASLAVGYDVKASEHREPSKVFTKDKLVVANNAPYDFIIVYDVLDHCEDPITVLKHIEDLCLPHTKVFIRNHPFCSRHGKHMFTTMNKAFLHMFFDDMELVRLCGNSGEFTRPVLRPLFEYRAWLAQSNFNVELETASTTPIEQYFLKPENYLLRDKILARYENDDPTRHMQIDFVDYVLRKKAHVII